MSEGGAFTKRHLNLREHISSIIASENETFHANALVEQTQERCRDTMGRSLQEADIWDGRRVKDNKREKRCHVPKKEHT